jgi:hypothetical protein
MNRRSTESIDAGWAHCNRLESVSAAEAEPSGDHFAIGSTAADNYERTVQLLSNTPQY